MGIVNLTPHALTIRDASGADTTIPPSGTVPRVDMDRTDDAMIGSIPVVILRPGALSGLPDPVGGTIYVASGMVAERAAAMGRHDVYAPDTSPQGVVRDSAGRVVGVKALARYGR